MGSKKEGYKRNIHKRRRRRKMIRLAASFLAFAAKIILTSFIAFLMLKASAAPDKEAAAQQTVEKEAGVTYKAARKQPAGAKESEWPSGPSFIPLDVPMSEEDQEAVFEICGEYEVAYTLVMAMIERESNFDASARSATGDSGLMQINDSNSDRLAEMGFTDLYDVRENVEAGVCILRELFEKYGEIEAVLMCYNMGEASAAELWEAGVYSSAYSSAIMAREAEFSAYIDNYITGQ